jgi:small subunit ribosomal protein S5
MKKQQEEVTAAAATPPEAVVAPAAAAAPAAAPVPSPAKHHTDDRNRRPPRRRERDRNDSPAPEFEERVVAINRSAKVVKGGRNFSFSALVVVGNRKGRVGVGFGKANEVADAIRKGGEKARKSLVLVPLRGQTLPHPVSAEFCGGKIMIRPASLGTGLIAGGSMRAVLELAGVRDALAKSLGSNNPVNVVKATMSAINKLHTRDEILAKRGIAAL